jgi:hypothetical protein
MQRVSTVWLGVSLTLAPIIGGNGMPVRGLAQVLLTPSLGIAFALIWLMLLWPAARELLHSDADRYLRSLPHARWQYHLLIVGLFLWMQLPVMGIISTLRPGLAGALSCGLATILLALSMPALRPWRAGQPSWQSPLRACIAIYGRGVWRRNGTAMVRIVGFCLLAGAALGAMLKNNGVADTQAVSLSLAILPLLCVPSVLPLLTALLNVSNASKWLWASYGVAHWQQWLAWLASVATCLVSCTLFIAITASVFGRFSLTAALEFTALSTAIAICNSALIASCLLWAARSRSQVMPRVVLATIAVQVAVALTISAAAMQSLMLLVGVASWCATRCRKSFS